MLVFFFQAEDGIRDYKVTGVQTCALPISGPVGEALVMTAAGLAVALPAVLAYNLLGRAAAQMEALLEGFAHDLQAMFGLEQPGQVQPDDGMPVAGLPAGPMDAP